MDQQTLVAYDTAAATFAQEWHEQPAPSDLHAIVRRFFKPGLSADVGCGSGRDVAWLVANGFPATGYDPCEGLLKEARGRYPHLEFAKAALPELTGVPDGMFENVLCETVLMHLDRGSVVAAVCRLIAILKPGGTLYLSWRVSETDHRDRHGRFYAALDSKLVANAFTTETVLLDERVVSKSSGKMIHRMVARKYGAQSEPVPDRPAS
ncbi:MAG: class I SAM-dependent methyltransferase [Bradyrhizobiaceae bacterium]|nr:class I SAM-dependent methyltransferase [Bradyrhizobiaceae bacterium]